METWEGTHTTKIPIKRRRPADGDQKKKNVKRMQDIQSRGNEKPNNTGREASQKSIDQFSKDKIQEGEIVI